MADFTPTQGRYLAFIHAYSNLHGYPPAEAEIAAALCVSPPSVNQMVKNLERRSLILRRPGQPRSIELLVPEEEIPPWGSRKQAPSGKAPPRRRSRVIVAPPAKLYVLAVYLRGGPTAKKFANKEISRKIELRGDQTLEVLHSAIFEAYDRWDEHGYEFQFGARQFDPAGPNFKSPKPLPKTDGKQDACKIKIDDLDLTPRRVFGYWFDFDDNWYHQVQVDRIEDAIPTVTYPRVIARVGKSPPQYLEE